MALACPDRKRQSLESRRLLDVWVRLGCGEAPISSNPAGEPERCRPGADVARKFVQLRKHERDQTIDFVDEFRECDFRVVAKSAAAVDLAKLPTLPSQPGLIDSKQGRVPGPAEGPKDKLHFFLPVQPHRQDVKSRPPSGSDLLAFSRYHRAAFEDRYRSESRRYQSGFWLPVQGIFARRDEPSQIPCTKS